MRSCTGSPLARGSLCELVLQCRALLEVDADAQPRSEPCTRRGGNEGVEVCECRAVAPIGVFARRIMPAAGG